MGKELKPTTGILHSVKLKDKYGSHVLPVYRTANYEWETPEDSTAYASHVTPEAYINKDSDGYFVYTRLGNPTVAEFEERIANLENGEGAVAFGSGMGAIATTLLTFLQNGDHAIYGNSLYSATTNLFANSLPRYGVETEAVDPLDLNNITAAIKPNTKMIYVETPANPSMSITDLRGVAKIAKEHGILTVADNTFASAYNTKPLDLGIDIVLESATKYIGGHGDALGGVAVSNDRKLLSQLVFEGITHFGACLSPDSAFLLSRGTKSFFVRVQQQCETAQKLAEFLEQHPAIDKIYYPGLPSHPQHELAMSQMKTGGAMMSIEVKGGLEAGKSLLRNLKIAVIAASLGDPETLVEHPASMSHASITPEERAAAGIGEGLVRISVGLEDADDLIEDFRQALDNI